MSNNDKGLKFYAEKARKLEETVMPKRWFTIREAGEILGYGANNTAATANCLQRLVQYGFVVEEWRGNYRKYYLP